MHYGISENWGGGVGARITQTPLLEGCVSVKGNTLLIKWKWNELLWTCLQACDMGASLNQNKYLIARQK